jgi:hypothetical protein
VAEGSRPTLVLYEPRGPHMWQPGCAAIGTLVGLAVLVTGQLGGLVLLVPFGAFLILSIFWYPRRPDRLTLDADGFTIARGAFDRRVLWSEIAAIEVVDARGRWIHVRLHKDDGRYPWRKTLPGSQVRAAPAIPLSYGMRTDDLANTLRQWHERANARGLPAPPPPPMSIGRYVVREDEGIGVELVRLAPSLSCVTLFIGFWMICWDAITIGMTIGLERLDSGAIVMLVIIWAVAIIGTYMGLRAIFERRSWLLRAGAVTELVAVRRLGEVGRRTYEPIERVEIRRGVWKTGAGVTDDLVLWVHGSTKPLVLEKGVEQEASRIGALGELVAKHVRRPLVVTERQIPEPKHGD